MQRQTSFAGMMPLASLALAAFQAALVEPGQ